MANDLRRVMTNFEQSIKKTGLPELPRLSQILYPESVQEVGEDSVRNVDRLEITPKTKPGWYNVAGKQIYLSQADIPTTKVIDGGSRRGTFTQESVPRRYDVKVRQVGLVPEESAFSEDNR